MIEHQIIDGREASIAYLDRDMQPTNRSDYSFARILFDDSGDSILLARDPTKATNKHSEIAGWNSHRARHRRPLVAPVGQLSRRDAIRDTPHNFAVRNFAWAMHQAEKHRTTLKKRFGYNDRQIATLATAALAKISEGPYHALARAAQRAKARLDRR